jgi:hypothetical protein
MNSHYFSTGQEPAYKYGVHEIILQAAVRSTNLFEIDCRVFFQSPTENYSRSVVAFYDGGNTWRARVYVAETGEWRWQSECTEEPELNNRQGCFIASESSLRGILRKSIKDPKQWQTEDGQWFLNLCDTAYLFFNEKETAWKAYIEDLETLGITSIRCGSLGGISWSSSSYTAFNSAYQDISIDNCPWVDGNTGVIAINRFQNTDNRLIYMLNHHPDIYIQFILFGLETWGEDDTGARWKSIPDIIKQNTMKYIVARWSAFPQLFWLVVNDLHCSDDYPNNQAFVREVGRYFAQHDPWNHLISAGPNRFADFPFTSPGDSDWVSYIHIEHFLALDAQPARTYDAYPLHVFHGEDWYEQTKIQRPEHPIINPRFFYRWLFWSWLLAGGSTCYGGRWARLHPYYQTDTLIYTEPFGLLIYKQQLQGLDSIRYIKTFFYKYRIMLDEFMPDEWLVILDQKHVFSPVKAARRQDDELIIYHPNAKYDGHNASVDELSTATVLLNLHANHNLYSVLWYRPADGVEYQDGNIYGGGIISLQAPWQGIDIVLYLKKVQACGNSGSE